MAVKEIHQSLMGRRNLGGRAWSAKFWHLLRKDQMPRVAGTPREVVGIKFGKIRPYQSVCVLELHHHHCVPGTWMFSWDS